MKNLFDKQKNTEKLNELVQNTTELSKKAAASAKSSVLSMMEKTKNELYAQKMKKYNPIFPEQYTSATFNLPNMIQIVDDAVRRGIDVCEGSIGWLGNETGVEILHLYDEAVPFSKLQFIPSADCDAVYYVDSFDRRRFIRLDCIFSKAHEERLAELKNVAYMLGAKRCSIEISESGSEMQLQHKKASFSATAKGVHTEEKAEQQFAVKDSYRRSGRIDAEFQGSDHPERPILKWFAHDDSIKRLIEMRCDGTHSVKSETLILSGASSATMSQKTAYTIDTALNKMYGGKGSVSMDSQAAKEHKTQLQFFVEF